MPWGFPMDRSTTIIRELLERMEIASIPEDGSRVIRFDTSVRETILRVMVMTEGNLLSVRVFYAFTVPVKRRKDAMEFAARASYWMRNGTFSIDLDKGRFAFSVAAPFDENTISAEELEELLNRQMQCAVHYLEHAAEPLLKLAHGFVRAKQAVALFDESRRSNEGRLRVPQELLDGQTIAVN